MMTSISKKSSFEAYFKFQRLYFAQNSSPQKQLITNGAPEFSHHFTEQKFHYVQLMTQNERKYI